jgi:hypothetical protein
MATYGNADGQYLDRRNTSSRNAAATASKAKSASAPLHHDGERTATTPQSRKFSTSVTVTEWTTSQCYGRDGWQHCRGQFLTSTTTDANPIGYAG